MISLTKTSNESFLTPGKKRRKETEKEKKSKKKKISKETVENVDTSNEEKEDISQESPIYIPTLSSPEPESPESVVDTPIQSHANVDLVTFSMLNSSNVTKLRQERDRLQFAGLRKRHTLLHQLDRSTWPVLFAVLRLQGHLSDSCVYENAEDFEQFRALLIKKEDTVLDALQKQYPPQKSANVVDVCSKTLWCIDPRYSTYLEQYGRVKQLMQTYHPSEEEEKMIIQNWKSSWDSKILGPISVKTQLKTVLFSQQHSQDLEKFLQNLLKTLHARAERLKEVVHLGEQYDFREYSNQHNVKQKNSEKTKTVEPTDKKPNTRKRCEGCNNDPSRQGEKKCVIATRRCIHFKHPDFNKSGSWMQSEIAKKYKTVGQHWIHADKQLSDGKMVSRSKDDKKVTPHFASLNNNMTTNLDELNTGYIEKPEVDMEFRADDGQAFSIQALLDPGSYSIHNDKSSLDENVSIVSYVSEEVANLIANKTQKSKSTTPIY